MKYTQIVAHSNDHRDIQLMRYILMGAIRQHVTTDD